MVLTVINQRGVPGRRTVERDNEAVVKAVLRALLG
jgi:hypothetical protein